MTPAVYVAGLTWDFNTATLSFIAVNIIIGLWSIFKTHARANAAYELAQDAEKSAKEAHAAIALMSANLSLLREQVAGDYPDHETMAAMEKRLIAEIHRLSDRLDQVLDRRPSRGS